MASDSSYYLQMLKNVLWYTANDHLNINEASKLAKEVTPIPKLFKGDVGYKARLKG